MGNFELLDNLFQIAVLLCACCAAGFFALRHKSRSLLILSLAYACFAMGTTYYVLYLVIMGIWPQVFYVAEISWLAAWLFYLSAQIERTEGRRVGFSCPAALAAAVLAATAFLDRDFGPSRLLSALFALTAGATVYLSVFHMQTGAQRRGRDALMTGCAALQVLLYLVSNFTRDYTRFNLYYAVDLTLTLSMAALLPLSGLLGALLLAGLARSAPPQMDALGNSLGLALAACALGAAVCLLWLACGPARGDGWVWLPLVLPALPLADGQYRLALYAWLDGDWWTVLWGHLLWVVPWMLFILRPAWRQRDPRLTVVARTLGWGSTRIFWLLTLPSLTRPLLTALAVGFSVSIAQYLPTLWLGAGRIPTLTSQAVALSSGGEAQTLAAQALWQLLLPAVCFTLTALLAWLAGRYRRGLR